MAKRTRSRSARRPGGQGPTRNKPSGAATSEAATTPVAPEADIDGAVAAVSAEYTEVMLEEPASTQAMPSTKRRRTRRSARAQAESLEGRVAAENVYVRQDLRRIGIISLVLLVGLAIAYVVFVVMDVLNLY